MQGPDLSILEDHSWWVPYHVPPSEGSVIVSGGVVLRGGSPPIVLIFDELEDAQEYLELYAKKAGGTGPDLTGVTISFEATWDGFDVHELSPAKVADVLIGSGHVPIVVHHAWADTILKKMRNQGIHAATDLAVVRHSQLARKLHGNR